jgi:hypothetical protein
MANRLIRNTAILLKAEATYGTDPTPTGSANAMLVSNLSITPINAQNVDRDIIRPFLGGSEQLLGTRYVEMGFDLELAGSGTVATAPAWAPALLAAGFAQTLTATIRADYLPISTSIPSNTIYWYDDGVLHKLSGGRSNAVLKLNQGAKPVITFTYTGLYSTPTATALPTITTTAWKTPQIPTSAFSQSLTLGASHNTALTPAFTGGTAYPSQGIEIDLGNSVNFNALIGGEDVTISQRSVSAKITIDADASQEVAFMTQVESATLTSIGMIHGTVANNKVGVFMPSCQLINPTKAELNGKRLVSFDVRSLPVSGNDELRIFTSF